jgi:hypothetical protein
MATSGLEGFLGKLEVTNEIGEALDKQRQRAEDQAQQLLGGSMALKAGALKVSELGKHVDKDLDEGNLQFGSELEFASYVKTYLRKAGEVLLNLAERSKSEELVAHGKAAAHRESLELIGRHCKSAKARADQLVAAAEALANPEQAEAPEEGPRGGARMPGERPGPSTLNERRAEARAASASNAEDSQVKLPVEPPAEPPPPTPASAEPSEPSAEPPESPPRPPPKPVAKKKTAKKTTKKRAKKRAKKTNRKPPSPRVAAP